MEIYAEIAKWAGWPAIFALVFVMGSLGLWVLTNRIEYQKEINQQNKDTIKELEKEIARLRELQHKDAQLVGPGKPGTGLTSPEGDNKAVIEYPNRKTYLLGILENIDLAQNSIWLSVNTLSPSRTSEDIKLLQTKLVEAMAKGVQVRMIAPSGYERVEGAYELAKIRTIPIKILTHLKGEDLRFTLVDQSISIISLEAEDDKGYSIAGAIILSEQLNRLLRKHFTQYWDLSTAMDYNTFLAYEVRRLLNPLQPPSRETIASKLHVPVPEIDHALTMKPAKIIFCIGRPNSGKTLFSHTFIDYLQSVGYKKDTQIYCINDYSKLYTKFKQDVNQRDFEPGPRNGFRVKNFGVLDDCLREINNIALEEHNRRQFIIIEFSRNNYVSAFENFANELLDNCTIYYLSSPISICIARNEKRAEVDDSIEAGYVPKDIMETYYSVDDIDRLSNVYPRNLVKIDNSQDNKNEFLGKITDHISSHLGSWILDGCKISQLDNGS
jgi:hypothetical protein